MQGPKPQEPPHEGEPPWQGPGLSLLSHAAVFGRFIRSSCQSRDLDQPTVSQHRCYHINRKRGGPAGVWRPGGPQLAAL
eukprot:9184929-Alexandrium_andersonii.AAC.1